MKETAYIACAALLLSVCAGTPARAETEALPSCGEDQIETRRDGDRWQFNANCEEGSSPDFPRTGDIAPRTQKASKKKSSPYKVNAVNGCYEDELKNLDFQDCAHQAEEFCGPGGRWLQVERIDTRLSEEDSGYRTYGKRFCATDENVRSSDVTDARMDAFSLRDVADLVTVAPALSADNGGRGIRHAHTNFYSDAGVIVEHTTLNGEPAILRATPIEYRWDYGDGTTRTTEVAGTSQSEFNVETATSHKYEETGEYTVNLSTVFTGEYSLDGGQTWIPIDGTITRESDPLIADIFRSVTRNVADDCVANPSAWGCGAPGSDGEPTD